MSDELISRKALMSHIESEHRQWDEDYDAGQILGDIEDFPTAYDMDKVIERLKNLKTDNSCGNCTYKEKCDELQEFYNPDDSVDLCGLTIKELAIEIVKSGGVANS